MTFLAEQPFIAIVKELISIFYVSSFEMIHFSDTASLVNTPRVNTTMFSDTASFVRTMFVILYTLLFLKKLNDNHFYFCLPFFEFTVCPIIHGLLPFKKDLTRDGDVESNPGPRKRLSSGNPDQSTIDKKELWSYQIHMKSLSTYEQIYTHLCSNPADFSL
ncbi:hypothetical protein RCL1_008467 [Eukaryota sp. TZLM3-RCL]